MIKLMFSALAVAVIFTSPVSAAKFKPTYGHSAKPTAVGGNRLVAKCRYKRINIGQERQWLRNAGYKNVRYKGISVFKPRCAQFARFTACKGLSPKKLTVRYIKGTNRYLIVQPGSGRCFTLAPN